MKLLILLLLSFITYINSQSISKVSSPQYGVTSMVIIDGSSFLVPTSVKIGSLTCSIKTNSATQITCLFSSNLTPVTSEFPVVVTFSGGSSLSSTLKYATPSIEEHGIFNSTYYYIIGLNLSPVNTYKLTVLDGPSNTVQLTPTADSVGQINFLLPKTITGGSCTFRATDTVGFTYPNPLDVLNVDPIIMSIDPPVWDPTKSSSVTIIGYFFGTNIKMKVGATTLNSVSVSSDGVAVFNSPLGFISDKKIEITTSKNYQMTFNDVFTYIAPTIDSTNQENNTIKIEASYIGTDSSFISVYINQQETDFTMENGIISVTLSPAINVGKTAITIKADVQNVTSSILVQPLLKNISSIPSVGGKVTIEGSFLNDCFFKLYDNTSKLIKDMVDDKGNNLCTLSNTGTVATCITPKMTANSTFTITAIRYVDNSDTSSESKTMSIEGTIYYVEPETEPPTDTPTKTPTEAPTEAPTSPAPYNSSSIDISDDIPSSSQKLLPNLLIIFSLIYLII